jgi:hypothetical protein
MSELKLRDSRACPECGGLSVYQTTGTSGTPHANLLLPGLGGFLRYAAVQIRVCADCGLTRHYADSAARAKLRSAARWTKL